MEQIDDHVTGATYDNLNRLVSQQPSGAMVFAGTVSEPAAVTVQGTPAVVTSGNQFRTSVPVGSGTNTVTVTARDPSGNVGTRQYEVDAFGSGRTFTYDANGNLTSDGTRTFEWDARNQLVAVTAGTQRTEYTYDGKQRRTRIVELQSGVTQADTRVIWCDEEICEERGSDGATARRSLANGEQAAGLALFFARDHLGSVTEVADNSAALVTRYAFHPWGRRTLVTGGDVIAVGYTGHRRSTDGWAAWFRTLDSETGRWISEDPLAKSAPQALLVSRDGPNLFAYTRNNPIRYWDPAGLQSATKTWRQTLVKVCARVGTAARTVLGVVGILLIQCGDGCDPSKAEERKARQKECEKKYDAAASFCADTYHGPDDYWYNKCMDWALANYIRCINGLPPKPWEPKGGK